MKLPNKGKKLARLAIAQAIAYKTFRIAAQGAHSKPSCYDLGNDMGADLTYLQVGTRRGISAVPQSQGNQSWRCPFLWC